VIGRAGIREVDILVVKYARSFEGLIWRENISTEETDSALTRKAAI
jgi:hypothetical protein